MVNVKGTAISGRRQYVLRHHGEEKLHSVLAQLKDQEAAKRIESGVLKSAWYPYDLFIELEILDFETPNFAHCESVLGWAQRSIELTGVKNVRADHLECRGKGARRCRMHFTWKA